MSTDTHAALAAPAEPPLRPLPFAFAKRHGVLLREPFGQAQLQVRRGASLTAVQEAQRFAGRIAQHAFGARVERADHPTQAGGDDRHLGGRIEGHRMLLHGSQEFFK